MEHFFDQVAARKLFSSEKKARDISIRALRRGGVLIEAQRDDCNYLCIFKDDVDHLVVVPVIDTGTHFICKTIFLAEDWHRKIYKNRKRLDKEARKKC